MTKDFWKEWFTTEAEWFEHHYFIGCEVRNHIKKIEKTKFAHGCSKFCIIDENAGIVLKWCTNPHYNEMAKEYSFYEEAIIRGLGCYFPKTEELCTIGEVTIYVQDMVKTLMSDIPYKDKRHMSDKHKTVTDEFVRKVCRDFYSCPPYEWVKLAISIYGKRRMKELCQFTKDFRINDLHESNVGFNGSFPVILDFSGYHRDDDEYSDDENSDW